MILFLPMLCLAVSLGASTPAAPAPPGAASTAAASGRVVFLGFDGADARTAAQLMEAGELPNLARLAEQGTFAPLGTTNPAESPVSWASLNSGRNPAETGVVGFVRRDYLADGSPYPKKGLAIDDVQVPLDQFDLPIPILKASWSPTTTGSIAGGVALAAFLIVFAGLLRLRFVPSLLLSAVLAAVGFWAGFTLRSELPPSMPVVKNPLDPAAAPFWELAAAQGVESIVLDAAQAFDRPPVDGARVLCGLGIPDARGDYISYFVYTTDPLYFPRDPEDSEADTGSGGVKLRVDERDGVIESVILGPKNIALGARLADELKRLTAEQKAAADFKGSTKLGERIKVLETELAAAKDETLTLPLRIAKRGDGTADVSIGEETQTLADGAWSDWYHLTFELTRLVKIHAITRVQIVSLDEPHFELYVNALEIDPAHPPFWQPISQPASFSKELVEATGRRFETVGWSCMTHPFKDEVVDPISFMQDIEFTMKWREDLTYAMLARDDWRLFVSLFSEPDRVQHMMYQYYDTEHPLYDAAKASQKMTFCGEEITLAEAIPAAYRQIDRIVGRVQSEFLRPEDVLLIGADHGFQSFRRQVHVNNWLVEHGYLVTKKIDKSSTAGMVHSYADWTQTKAYSMGLGTVYLNLKGREPKGIVEPSEAQALMEAIRSDFLATEDPDHPGTKIGSDIDFAADIHSGPHFGLDADMFLCFAPNYRSSWSSAGGALSVKRQEDGTYVLGPTVVPSNKMWSGDHVSVDPEHVKGIFYSNRKLALPEGGANLLHIAPTTLALLGLQAPPEMDLPALAAQ